MTPFLTTFASEEFERRLRALSAAVDAGQIGRDAANANARLWLAIARAAGAELPQMCVERIWPAGTTGIMHPLEIADAADWRAELERARDHAVRRALANTANPDLQQRAWGLQSLAVNLGCREAITIEPEREAA